MFIPRGHSPRVDSQPMTSSSPRGRVDREHRDAVVTAVRVVEKSSARVDADLCGGVGAGEVVGQSRDGVLPDERAPRCIVVEHRNR